jgi:ATPase
VITKKQFSDGLKITAARPVAKLNLKNYQLKEKLKERLTKNSNKILIAGSPGKEKTI